MRKLLQIALVVTFLNLALSSNALAIGATLVFKSGLRVYINNGYDKVVDALSRIDSEARHKVVSLDVEGGIFLLDVSEVVIVCKERCSSIEIVDTRATARQ